MQSLRATRLAARTAGSAIARPVCVAPVRPCRSGLISVRRDGMKARASAKEDMDFDALLATWADKFEKVENKPVVVGYIIAAFAAFFTTEWLIHLPALDILLGFPIQLLGVLIAPVLAVRYLVDKKDISTDVLDTVADISKLLPGLEKK